MNTFKAHIKQLSLTPNILLREFPLTCDAEKTVLHTRQALSDVIHGRNEKLIAIVGPCSIHDFDAAMEYAYLLKNAAARFADDLLIIMRVYFEKPRTTLGWKGLISDPLLDGSFQIETGLRLARKLLLDINHLGLPTATEFLDPMISTFIYDLVAWSAIGARTSNSPLHRELASGLPMPVGFKNTIDGNINIAIDAVKSAAISHHYLHLNADSEPSIVQTFGNTDCHVILRGSQQGTNFDADCIAQTAKQLQEAGVAQRLIIDCSHGNSKKDYRCQTQVAQCVAEQIRAGSTSIGGIMLESHLVEGKQSFNTKDVLTYGQSITDACLSWNDTLPLLEQLAYAKKESKKNFAQITA